MGYIDTVKELGAGIKARNEVIAEQKEKIKHLETRLEIKTSEAERWFDDTLRLSKLLFNR